MTHVKSFLAGFVSTLIFHQGMLALLHAGGLTPRAPYNLAATSPFGIPAVISLAFWGGLWGIVLWLLIRGRPAAGYWLRAIVFGALGPTVVALFVVLPLKGQPVAGGWQPQLIVGALLLNAAWGFGVGLLMKLFAGKGSRAAT